LNAGIRLLVLALFILLAPAAALADWVNLTGAENSKNIAEIYVNHDHVKVKLEIFVEDLKLFRELIPNRLFQNPPPGRPGLEQRMQQFSEQTLQIITETGEKLTAQVDLVEPRLRVTRPSLFAGKINPYTRRIIPGPPDDKRVLYAELSYPFKKPPNSLTIIPLLDERGLPRASIGFICYHLEVPVVDFRNLTAKNTVHLDWEDPWYSAFEKNQLKRTLQSGVRTYLYIEPYEVRHEILVRVKDMMTWLDLELKGETFIEEDEFNPVRQRVAEFFLERENVLIDGKRLKPILDRTAYVESSITRSRFIEIPERMPLNTAMIGVVITYLTDGIPQEVVTRWELFSDKVTKVTAGMTDPAGPFPYYLSPEDNVLKWTNHLKKYTIPTVDTIPVEDRHRGFQLPVISLAACFVILVLSVFTVRRYRQDKPIKRQLLAITVVCIIGGVMLPYFRIPLGSTARASQISAEETKLITQNLLKYIYRAFDFRDEEDIYDKLAVSVSGDLLAEIYLQNRKSMVIEQAGGAQAKVKHIEVLEAGIAGANRQTGTLDIRTQWTALGTVGHWGHVHTRQNLYDAILTLAVVDGAWKLTGIELLEEQRVVPGTKTVATAE